VIFLYQLPNWAFCLLIVSTFTLLSLAGWSLTRGWAESFQPPDNDAVGYFLSATGTIYAVLLAMVAVASWNNYVDTGGLVAREAGLAGDLFRGLESYPPAQRDELRQGLYDYVTAVVEVEWPAIRRGEREQRAALTLDALYEKWEVSKPAGDVQRTVHAAALERLNDLLKLRESRLQQGEGGILPALWLIVLAGFAINIGLTYFLRIQSRRLHRTLSTALGLMFGLVIYLIAAMDHPLWGDISVSPDAFQAVREQMDRRLHPDTPGQRRLAYGTVPAVVQKPSTETAPRSGGATDIDHRGGIPAG
jgi:hypothetical protein